jgi:hypothetical protein
MIHENRLCVGKALGRVFLLLGEFLAPWQTNKTQCEFNKGFFGEKKCQSCYIMRKNICHMSPYIDNEFLLVARTRQNSKKFYFIKTLQNFIYFIV